MIRPVKLPPGLEPSPTNTRPRADGGTWLVIELDGGRVYLDDAGELFALPEHAAIRDRLVDHALETLGTRSCVCENLGARGRGVRPRRPAQTVPGRAIVRARPRCGRAGRRRYQRIVARASAP